MTRWFICFIAPRFLPHLMNLKTEGENFFPARVICGEDGTICAMRTSPHKIREDLLGFMYSIHVCKYSLVSRSMGINAVYLLSILQALLV